jgi:IS5 family transposase
MRLKSLSRQYQRSMTLRPLVLILTPGNTADCTVGPACVSLLDGIKESLGDKAYDSNSFRKSLRKDGIRPVIPGQSSRKKRIRHDKEAYRPSIPTRFARR